MSACPACRSVSAIMWTRILCSVASRRSSGPPRHLADRVEWQRLDRCVRLPPCSVAQGNDLIARFIEHGPQVRIGLGIVGEPRQRLAGRRAEGVAEIPQFDAG
jgi:hypothetical protein